MGYLFLMVFLVFIGMFFNGVQMFKSGKLSDRLSEVTKERDELKERKVY